jgi:DNA-binding MarR family transcriptional regulator
VPLAEIEIKKIILKRGAYNMELKRPVIVRLNFIRKGNFEVPGVEVNVKFNERYGTFRISEQFIKMAQMEVELIAIRKLKDLAFKKPVYEYFNIFTDQLVSIDHWPIVTEEEYKLWKDKKDLALYYNSYSIQNVVLKILNEEHRLSPNVSLSVKNFASLMKTTVGILAPEILALQQKELVERRGSGNTVDNSDWIKITDKGIEQIRGYTGYSGIKLSESYKLLVE